MNTIKVTNHLGESLTLDLRSPEKSGLAVLFVEGLGPVKADISLTERAGIDGSIFNSSRGLYRNVVIDLRYMMDPDIATNRHKSYQYFPLKQIIRLDIVAGNREAYVYGYVESNESNIFNKDSGCSISILCPESYLYDVDEAIVVFSSVTALFEFPFSNESLVTPLLELSELIVETEKNVFYTGEASIGMLIHIHANGSASGVVITHTQTLETLSIDSTKLTALLGSDISSGDDIYISTVNGNKYAILVRGSTTYNILNCLGSEPTWFQLVRGDNPFTYNATSGLANLDFKMTYDIAYEGI